MASERSFARRSKLAMAALDLEDEEAEAVFGVRALWKTSLFVTLW